MKRFSHSGASHLGPVMRRGAVAVAAAIAAMGSAQAIDLKTGNPDVSMEWNNTILYNYAYRTQSQDQAIINAPNYNDGDRNFDKGTVGNRVDLLSEFNFIYRKHAGFRVSAAGWYDGAYSHLDNTSVATSNHLAGYAPALGLSDYTKRYYQGPSGEFLDAFVFDNFQAGKVPVNVKLGQFNLFWGEALLNPIHSLSYGQSSLDLGKMLAVPGSSLQELFRPRQQVAVQIQASPKLSLAAQYFLKFDQVRYPEAGSYMWPFDMLNGGGESLFLSPTARALRGQDVTPSNQGDWGLAARISPDALDGTVGLYYRRTSDIQPQINVLPGVAALPAATCQAIGKIPIAAATCYINTAAVTPTQLANGIVGQYFDSYASGIDILGLSLSKDVDGISVGGDLNYRRNMPLTSIPVQILPAPLAAKVPGAISAIPAAGQTGGARGNTWHGVLNFTGIVPKTPTFDTANYIVEFVWNRWASVTQNPGAFTGSDSYTGIDKASKDYYGVALNFTPTWFQVRPGVDLQLPISYSVGLKGNSSVTAGGNAGTGSYSIGIGADVYQKYRFDLKYNGYFGSIATNAADQITSYAGLTALMRDRGNISFTFKTTF